MSRDLLYEIGVEEVPASYVPPALDALRDAAVRLLAAERLDHGAVESYATPRRFALVVREVAERQRDLERTAIGPAARVAFDASGAPTAAARGFARGQGVEVEALERTATEKGDYVVARIRRPGIEAARVLPGLLVEATRAMVFPRTMRWGGGDLRFARPIRWLLALLGDELLPVALDGLAAGRETLGLRFRGAGPMAVGDPGDYRRRLAAAGVVLDPVERRGRIEAGLEAAAAAAGGRLVGDAELLDEVNYLVEHPTVIRGSFDPAFLDLPRDVITMALRAHQRYFAVEREGGGAAPALENAFLCVVNGPAGPGGLDLERVRSGHERVLRARLEDARFYWERDLARGIEGRDGELAQVVWQQGLGTLADKTRRLADLAVGIATGWDPQLRPVVERAALLAKLDQVSEMVRDGKEFTALEGRIGAEYARAAGESAEVCAAIAEQYLPRGADDRLPATAAGAALAAADKLDHVTGAFVAGKIPSGSEDPFAVRRAANGLLRIFVDGDRHVSLGALIGRAIEHFGPFLGGRQRGPLAAEIAGFFKQRLGSFLAERGVRYDLAAATVEGSMDDPADVRRRSEALVSYSGSDDFVPLVIGYKRVANILRGPEAADRPALDAAALTEPAEVELHRAARAAAAGIAGAGRARRFDQALAELLKLRRPIDRFFDEVMVMDEDRAVRGLRLALLAEVRDLFTGKWDFSQVVVEGEKDR